MKVNLTKNREVSNHCEPYIIAELGANHNGDMTLAKKLIIEAKESGADCVKFQSWSKNSVFSAQVYEKNHFIADDYRDRDDYTLEEIVEEYAISEQELLDMKKFSDEIGIDFTSTPFSKEEVDFLVDKIKAPFLKVASMDLNNYPLLEYMANKGKPIVLSTGLSELHEIDKAIKTIEKTGNKNIIILHCVATYPPVDTDVNLNNIKTLMAAYPEYPIGFSDHTLGTAVPLASVAIGVCLIEKHFTLDKEMEGWDHKVSATKDEMKIIVDGSKKIFNAMGSFRLSAPETEEQKREFRRSVVVTRDMQKGDVIKESDLGYKRPGGGFTPDTTELLIGRTLSREVKNDTMLRQEDLI